jgi:hypothetical protein
MAKVDFSNVAQKLPSSTEFSIDILSGTSDNPMGAIFRTGWREGNFSSECSHAAFTPNIALLYISATSL